MSRSYKKNPVCKDNEGKRKKMKRIANKRVRKDMTITNGKQYKKVSNSYDIVDYRSYRTYEKFKGSRSVWGELFTKDDWERWYKRK